MKTHQHGKCHLIAQTRVGDNRLRGGLAGRRPPAAFMLEASGAPRQGCRCDRMVGATPSLRSGPPRPMARQRSPPPQALFVAQQHMGLAGNTVRTWAAATPCWDIIILLSVPFWKRAGNSARTRGLPRPSVDFVATGARPKGVAPQRGAAFPIDQILRRAKRRRARRSLAENRERTAATLQGFCSPRWSASKWQDSAHF